MENNREPATPSGGPKMSNFAKGFLIFIGAVVVLGLLMFGLIIGITEMIRRTAVDAL